MTAASHTPGKLRPVVADDGNEIMLTVYDADRAVVAVALSVSLAVNIAGELIAAISRRLAVADGSESRERRGRGHRTAKTVDALQNGNRAIARLRAQFFGDLGISQAALAIAREGGRYEATKWRFDRQKPIAEISDERRQLLAQVLHGRSRFPGARRIRTLIREMNSAPIHFPNSSASGEHEDRDFG